MDTFRLLEGLNFKEDNPLGEPLLVNRTGRIIRFTLLPGQVVREHNAPHSPVYIVVLKGTGMFSGGDGVESEHGPHSLLTFAPGENHAIRALETELVFALFLHEAPRVPS